MSSPNIVEKTMAKSPAAQLYVMELSRIAVVRLLALEDRFALLDDVLRLAVSTVECKEPSTVRDDELTRELRLVAATVLGDAGLYVAKRNNIMGRLQRTVWVSSAEFDKYNLKRASMSRGDFVTQCKQDCEKLI